MTNDRTSGSRASGCSDRGAGLDAVALAAIAGPARRGVRRDDGHGRVRRAPHRPPPAPSTAPVERPASAAPSDAGYTGPAGHDHLLDLGRPDRDQEPAGDRRRVPRGQPEHHGQGRPSSDWDPYWDKLQTGIAGGAAPDVFAMDGPLFPDYQTRDVLLDLKPFIDRDGYDLASSPTRRSPTSRRRDGQFGLPRDLNVDRPLLQQEDVRRGRDPLPGRHLGLGQARRRRQAADDQGRRTARPRQWGFYTETTDMENYWSSLVWQNGGDIVSRRQEDEPSSAPTRRPAASSSSRT